MRTFLRNLGALFLVGALGFAAGWRLHKCPETRRPAPPARVSPQTVDAGRPRGAPLPLLKHLTERQETPRTVSVAPKAVLPDVSAYCADFAQRTLALAPQKTDTLLRMDTVTVVDTVPPSSRALFPPLALKVDPGRLLLWLPRSDGSEWRGEYSVGRHYTAVTMQDTFVVRSRRGDVFVRWGGRILWAGVGAAIEHFVH